MEQTDRLEQESYVFKNVTAICGGATASLGALGLLGWISGLRVLASLNPNYVPVAPDTAAILVLFGSILFIHAVRPWSRRQKTFVGIIVALASLYGVLKFIGYFAKVDLTFENILFPISEKLGSYPIARMSPITGILSLLCGVALLLTLWNNDRQLTRNLVGGFGIVVSTVGFIAVVGYLYGTPLLYGGDIIPLAATTSLAFLLQGYGLVVAAGPANVFLRPWVENSVRAKLLRAFVPLVAMAVLIQGLFHEIITELVQINHAFLAAITSLIFVAITSAIVIRVAQVISRAIDTAEAERKRAEERLVYQAHLLENVHDAIVASDAEYRLTVWNVAAEKMYGWNAEKVLGRNGLEIVQTQFSEAERAEVLRAIQEKGYYRGEATQVRKDGSRFPVDVSSIVLRDEAGQTAGYVSVNRDITERKQAEQALRQAEEKYRAIVDSAVEGIFQSTPEGRFITANPALAHMWGYASSQELISSVTDIAQQIYVDSSLRAEFRRLMEEQGKVQGFEFQTRRKDGSTVWVSENARAVRDSNGAVLYYEGTIEDVTARKQAEMKLQYLSVHDALTGLYNRNFFEEELARWESSRHFPFSIVIADINRMKETNDSLGHAAGDELLRRAAQVFRTAFRSEDAVARIGGDEFAVLLPDTDDSAVAQVLARLRNCIDAENDSRRDASLSLALGAATGDERVSLIDVMKEADQRMYEDKSANGKNAGGD